MFSSKATISILAGVMLALTGCGPDVANDGAGDGGTGGTGGSGFDAQRIQDAVFGFCERLERCGGTSQEECLAGADEVLDPDFVPDACDEAFIRWMECTAPLSCDAPGCTTEADEVEAVCTEGVPL